MDHTILLVDDEPRMCRSLEILLESENKYRILTAGNAQEALSKIESEEINLVVTDLTMPGMDGMQLLKKIKENFSDIQVIMMTAYSTVQSAIEAIKIGAYDYLVKPFDDDQFLLTVKNALEVTKLRNENIELRQQIEALEQKGKIFVSESKMMKEISSIVEKVANTPSNILITGESGSGKEVVARLIHSLSNNKKNRFIAINCASIPDTLLESELFGHEKGAFSGAISKKKGKFELAPNGVLFLDEIGEMPLPLQAKLLRVIEERSFERLGGISSIEFSSRIITATNKDLKKLVKEEKFREDLYFRLHVVHIKIPSLRERREDIPHLIDLFLETKCKELGLKQKKLSPEARHALQEYDFPGNVRELANIIESSLIASKTNTIRPKDLPLLKHELSSGDYIQDFKIDMEKGFKNLDELKSKFEKNLIIEAMKIYPNMSNTELAEKLGTTRRILETRIKQYKIKKETG